MENYNDITELIYKHLRNELTQKEKEELKVWVDASAENTKFFSEVSDAARVVKDSTARQMEINLVNIERPWEKAKALGLPAEPDERKWAKIFSITFRKIAIAACVLLFVTVGVLIYLNDSKPKITPTVVTNEAAKDAKPNVNASKLVLNGGREIILDSVKSGVIARQGNMTVIKQSNGAIIYSVEGSIKAGELIYNTVSVPKGGDVVHLGLEDGSEVWLNAESSIRYPIAFNSDERKVEITGEGYFEVAPSHSPGGVKRSFIVSKGSMNVIVLGTKFNVNTYENEANVKVTLVEGSVKVQQSKSEKIIKPGQQAILHENKIQVETDVDIEQVMSWKNGKFVFRSTNIQVIMRQMARWYNLDSAQYENEEVRSWQFTGEVSRYSNASKVLELLQKSGGGNFKIEGKKIIISK